MKTDHTLLVQILTFPSCYRFPVSAVTVHLRKHSLFTVDLDVKVPRFGDQ